ncbi:MAG: L-2-amino-thiazoline-4-carboxylic acid hydrolase [archaeon]|nr:MAG: L-2-amino-thiazoline-4-carboxylic acid hydrolase [archaeon]
MDYNKKIREEAKFHAKSLIAIVRAVEEKYGKEGVETVKNAWLKEVFYKPWQEAGQSVENNDIRTLKDMVEQGCTGTHEWEKVTDEPNRVAYKFTGCVWAEIFRELGAPEIGKWFCDSDPVYVEAFNPKIKFKRTKTLMEGDECCDHIFYTDEKGE